MLLDQETLRFIFGLKLRTLRQEKGLNLNELGQLTKLSPSYLNEIEKGKKYPKTDKISVLANALGVTYDELISIKLSRELELLSKVIENNLLKGLPFEVFGLSSQTLLELIASRPQELGAFFGTILELVRNHGLSIEEFFHATLRAYLDLHENYLPDIEKAVVDFKKSSPPRLFDSNQKLKEILLKEYGVEVREMSFDIFPKEVQRLFSLFYQDKKPLLALNKEIDEREKRFILARELGFAHLGIKDRPSSSAAPVDSFDPLLNNLKAAYFASALLIPEDEFVPEIKAFFSSEKWSPGEFKKWVLKYPGTIESFFHRFSQLLPKHFGMAELFYLRVRMNTKNKKFALSRELHLSSAHGPHQAKETEHYCRRWITTTLLEKSIDQRNFPMVGAQRSDFFQSGRSYLNLCMVSELPVNENRNVASTIGIHINDKVKKTVKFLNDPAISVRQVADTCERCSLEDCAERASPPKLFERLEKQRRTQEALTKAMAQLENSPQ